MKFKMYLLAIVLCFAPIYAAKAMAAAAPPCNPLTDILCVTVTPSAVPPAGGTINPSTKQYVDNNLGATLDFTITPNPGYSFSVGGTCGGTLVGNTFTTFQITQNCTVVAQFAAFNLPQTGQTTCWDSSGTLLPSCSGTGQNGDLQSGVAWPSPRFTNSDASTPVSGNVVIDQLTALMWTTSGNVAGKFLTWTQALDYVAGMNNGKYQNYGYNDWRLPDIIELESLLNAQQGNNGTWLYAQGFTNVQSSFYWSSTTSAYDTSEAWYVSMGSGFLGYYGKSGVSYVWPVRTVQQSTSAMPWATGQTTSYYANDDGASKKGESWPSPRFSDNSDGTVTDNLTFLVWLKNANCFNLTNWQNALNWANGLANGQCGLIDGSVAGNWHLPTKKELLSLVDFSRQNLSLPSGGNPFTNVQSSFYWSSTTDVTTTDSDAWHVSMRDGGVSNYGKSNSNYVWPVRLGQAGNLVTLTISISPASSGSGTITSSPCAPGTCVIPINCSSSGGGSCSTQYIIPFTTTLTAVADSGSTFTGWSGDGCSGILATCKLNSRTNNANVTATFTKSATYVITPSADPNGTLSPLNPQTVAAGATQTFSVTPNTGYSALVGGTCGGSLSADGTTYTTAPIIANCTVVALFRLVLTQSYTVTASAGANGSINPSGTQTVPSGTIMQFTITPNPGYSASVGGSCGGSLVAIGNGPSTYTTAPIIANCTVSASFTAATPININLPQTGQTSCWNAGGGTLNCSGTGEDGDIKAGSAWPAPRFTDNGDGSMTDVLTGLIWTKDAGTQTVGSCTGGAMAWANALGYVACLNNANYLGHNDWRLPNINEFESLLNTGQINPGQWLATQGYTNIQSYNYWSSTTFAKNTSNAWLVNIWSGYVNYDGNSNGYYVWPVRGQSGLLATSPIWATGQTQSYHSGDDGAIHAGVVWPSPRFTDNGDQTVTDALTALQWAKDASTPTVGTCTGATMAWTNALIYVACLNNANYLNHNDWRLPNRKELRSLADYSKYSAALPAGNLFSYVQLNAYWSSTTYTGNASNAWSVDMSYGNVGYTSKSGFNYVWPVRGGQVGNSATLAVLKSGSGSGTVTSSDGQIICGGTCSASYNQSITTTLSATAGTGSTFAGWSGACSGTGTCTLNSSGSVNVTATFTTSQTTFTVTPSAGTNGSIYPSTPQTVASGTKTQFTVTPGTGYTATVGGTCGGTLSGNTYTTAAVTTNCTVVATFTQPVVLPMGDFNGDHKYDILWQNSTTGAVVVWLLNATSINSASTVYPSVDPVWQIKGVGDFDGDGMSDILWQNSSTGSVVVWLLNGASIKGTATVYSPVDSAWQIKGVGDFDGDGHSDILWQNSTTGQVVVWLLNGTTIKSTGTVSISSDSSWLIMGVGDFDGDGHSDILWQNSTTGAVAVWLLNGATIKSGGYLSSSLPSTWQIKAVGDFDGDGKCDLLLQNSTTGSVAAWLLNGAAIKSGGYLSSSADPGWQIMGVGDFDGDGMSDILWQNSSTGAVAAWLLNGATIKSSGYVFSSVDPVWLIK